MIRSRIFTLAFAFLAYATAEAAERKTAFSNACHGGESWSLGGEIREDFTRQFADFISGSQAPVRAFSNALAMRRLAQDEESKAFAEYWISRALYQAGLLHIAQVGFTAVATREVREETYAAQLASIQCLLAMQERYPSLTFPMQAYQRVPELASYAKGTRNQSVIWQTSLNRIMSLVADERLQLPETEKYFALLSGSGAYEMLAHGFVAAKKNEYGGVIREMDRFLNPQTTIPEALRRYTDTAHVTMARALYSRGEFEGALHHFKQVSKKSNELANSLSELSWAYLMADRYAEAIGTAMNLQAGGLRNTYAPEAPMVMAMALNELCQYPESVRAANIFKKHYEEPYRWLSKLKDGKVAGVSQGNLYPLAVQFLKKKNVAPVRVASEWVRSPLFISSQEHLNLIFDEQEAAAKVGRTGAQEQRKLAMNIVRQLLELKPKVKAARAKLKADDPLPEVLAAELRKLKSELTAFRRMQQAAPYWRTVLAKHQRVVPGVKDRLVARINADLANRSDRMLLQLDEIAENVQLIEIEIYNGASQDIIWQNAHPDYRQLVQQMKEESKKASAGKVWDWGRAPATAEETTEIWEDELGSFKADLYDNCSSRDKYLALKSLNRAQGGVKQAN